MTTTNQARRSPKSQLLDAVLCFLFGILGVHRFYEGKIATGVAYLLTLGFLGVGVVADLIQILAGVRLDKLGRHIGRPLRTRRRLVNAISIVAGIVIVAAAFATYAHFANEQNAITDDYYRATEANLPVEKTYADAGPSSVSSLRKDSGETTFSEYTVFYPSNLLADDGKTYPAVVFSNASNAPVGVYEPILKHLASWGFIAVGNDDKQSGNGTPASQTLDFLLGQNSAKGSELRGHVDVENIGLVGYSQGAAGALNAATQFDNSGTFSSVFVVSPPSLPLIAEMENDWAYDLGSLDIPMAAVAGTGGWDSTSIAPLSSLIQSYDALPPSTPGMIARRVGTDHEAMLTAADPYMTAWFRYTLTHDDFAAGAFAGDEPEISKNPLWSDVETKHLTVTDPTQG